MSFNQIELNLLPEVLRLNNNEVPHVNELNLDSLTALCNEASIAEVAIDEFAISGAMLGFVKGAEYSGFNFNWFCQRYQDFLYIDRIFVSPMYRGQGIGKACYDRVANFCKQNGLTSICCEVNEEPPNPGSHKFHLKSGFKAIELVAHPEGKTVVMYRKAL